MKNRHLILISLFMLFFLSGCDVAKQVSGTYNMINCKYDYNSINNINLAGIDFNKGASAANIIQATALLSGRASSVPLNFTLNLDVANPNQSNALLNGLDYILTIDNVQFTTGTISQSLNVPGGQTALLPLTIGFDLATLLTGDSKDAVSGIVKNFLGVNNKKSNVSFQIRPTFMLGNQAIASPVYIPVNFAFGGSKK